MRRSIILAGVVVISAGLIFVGQATLADGPTTQPGKKAYQPVDHVTGNYGKLKLAAEQEAKIVAIQQDEKKKTRAIQEAAEDAIELLLDDAQKKQLDEMDKDARSKQKARTAEKRAHEKAEKADKKSDAGTEKK